MTSSMRKLHRPFAALEQRELKRLVQVLGGSAVDVALLVALRVRASADGATSDTLGSLALWAGLGVRTVKDHVAWLEQRGIVRRRLEHAKGGAQGQAWRHRIEILRFEERPVEEQVSPAPSSDGEETAAPARSSAEVSAAPAPSSPTEEGAAKGRRGGSRAREEGAARRGITQTSSP